MPKIRYVPMEFFINELKVGRPFSLAGYSDAEWFSILNHRIGCATGLGQILDSDTGEALLDVLKRRWNDNRFMVAVPDCILSMSDKDGVGFESKIDELLLSNSIHWAFCERDCLLDGLAEKGGLFPFIEQLQWMDTVVIGPEPLRRLDFLGYNDFVEVSSPNLHLESNGIERAVEEAVRFGAPAVYLVSAGMSAALIIDQLHDVIPNSFFIDCGSIWDAFVGIGGQRPWRAELYADSSKLERWKRKNLGVEQATA